MTMPSLEVDFSARVCASLDGMAAALDRESAWRRKVAGALSQVPFAGSITLSAGAGTYDSPGTLKAATGFIWSIRRLSVIGFSAGQVTAFRNSTSGEPVATFAAPAATTTPVIDDFGRGELMLMPDDRTVWSATGITGTVSFWGVADCFESWYLPFYIG